MSPLWQSTLRVLAVVRKELAETTRQPQLALVLVLGPFLVLLVFGLNLKDDDPNLRTVMVIPEGSPLAEEARRIDAQLGGRISVVDYTSDRASALQRLRDREIDLVIELPRDPVEAIRAGRQAGVAVFHDRFDPVEALVIALSASAATDSLNQQVWQGVVESAQIRAVELEARVSDVLRVIALAHLALELGSDARAAELLADARQDAIGLASAFQPFARVVDRTDMPLSTDGMPSDDDRLGTTLRGVVDLTDEDSGVSVEELAAVEQELIELRETLEVFGEVPPAVLVDPFDSVTERVTSGTVRLTDFYAPAVLVLLIQHVVVTFLGLSVVRDEQLGTVELFKVSPISAINLIVGKSLAQMLVAGTVSITLVLLLLHVLGVPQRAPWWALTIAITGLLFASCGLGFITGLLATNDRQAVQYAMMTLLASIFLGGFILTLERFTSGLQLAALVMPATHGNILLREGMLRGLIDPLSVMVLFAMGALLLVADWLLLRRRLTAS